MENGQWQIVIAERGWIFAGRVTREGDQLVLRDAWNVRRFSLQTKNGLGGLANSAPRQGDDELDRMPDVRVHVLATIASAECNQEAWGAWFAKVTGHEAKPEKRAKR